VLDAVVGMQGKDGGDGSSEALAHPVRGERAYWRALAWCWACVAWPMPASRVPRLCMVMISMLCRFSRTRFG
jgi:hypothetical protein